MEMPSSSLKSVPRIAFMSILASAVLLLLHVFEWSIIDAVTPFLFLPLEGIAWLIFIAVSIGSVVHWIRHRRLRRSWLPLLICCATVCLVFTVPFTRLWLRVDFVVRRHAREHIVQDVSAGKLGPFSGDGQKTRVISLPADAPQVSMGGNEILEEVHDGKTYLFFFTFRGILDSYAGFLFVPTGGDPRAFGDLNETPATSITRYSEHWFFASHH
jgi:hypothetical protein